MKICVFCASSETIDKAYIKTAEDFGRALAANGDSLVFGAGKYGLMGAVARGVRQNGGSAVGVIPRFFGTIDVMFTDCEIIKTDSMRERKHIMEDAADAFVMLPGGIGTFEEFFEILTLKQLGRHKKPIAVYNLRGYYDSLFSFLEQSIAEGFMSREVLSLFYVSDSMEQIFAYLKKGDSYTYNKYNFLEDEDGKDKL